jgi:hypothetical protein
MRIKIGKSGSFGSGTLRLRITEFILRNEGLRYEAIDSWPSASSPQHADAPPTSIRVIPIFKPIIPLFHYTVGMFQLGQCP